MAKVTITFSDEFDAPEITEEGDSIVHTECNYGDLDKKNPTKAQVLAGRVMSFIQRGLLGGETLETKTLD